MKKRPRILTLARDGLALAMAGVLLFAAFEIAVTLFWPQSLRTEYIANGPMAVKDSTLGHLYRPNVHARVTGPEFEVEYRLNSDGLRDRELHEGPKRAGSTRVLLLGDSFTFGTGNEYETIWPVVFERAVRSRGYDIDVVKAGIAGYDTRSEVLYLERIFSRYVPDIVVVVFLPNDLFTNAPVKEGIAFYNENVTKFTRDKSNPLNSVVLARRMLMGNDRLYAKLYLMTARRDYFAVPAGERFTRQVDVTRALLSRAQRFCRDRGAQFIVLSIPQQFQVIVSARNGAAKNIDVHGIDRIFEEFARRNGFAWIPTLDTLSENYRAERTAQYFRFDGHLNRRGNKIVGDYLATEFVRMFADRR